VGFALSTRLIGPWSSVLKLKVEYYRIIELTANTFGGPSIPYRFLKGKGKRLLCEISLVMTSLVYMVGEKLTR